jgi:hypothetical protein
MTKTVKPSAFMREFPGFYFPIQAGAKFPPLFKNNLNFASDKLDQWHAWARQWPDCNWGLSIAKSGLIVADVDCKPGKNGLASFLRADLEHRWPETLTARTPSGGLHLYYRQTNAVRFVTGRQDIFGPGSHVDAPGYVLIPGCRLEGVGFYSILDYRPIALAPEWLAEYLVHEERGKVEQSPAVELDTPDLIEWAIHHLTRDAAPCIEGNGGERTMLLLAGVLKDHGISEECAVELITEHFNGGCEPPWNVGDGELADRLDVKIANAYRYLRQTQPGRATAQADFGDADVVDAAHIEAIAAWWKEFDGKPRPIRERKSVTDGFVETGRQSRGSDPLPIVRKVP